MTAAQQPQRAGADMLYVLSTEGPPLAKHWRADGRIEPAAHAWQFTPKQLTVKDLRHLSKLLTIMEPASTCALIRGAYIGDAAAEAVLPGLIQAKRAKRRSEVEKGPEPELQPGRVLRVSKLFIDQALHATMIDIDDFKPDGIDPVAEPVAACKMFIERVLPACFHGRSFHWQLSGSAGHPNSAGKLKAHVWFWLETAYDSAALRAWAMSLPRTAGAGIDAAVYSPVQLLFTAAPIFDEGVVDPVPGGRRSGLHQGEHEAVPLVLDQVVLDEALARQQRQGAPAQAGKDPGDKDGWHGAFCSVFKPKDLAELMPDEFTASEGRAGHFDWHGRDSVEGVYITPDGHHLVSMHNTAPTEQGRACSIFDFCRLHMFGTLDLGIDDGVGMTRRPSYIAMVERIKGEYPEVVEDFQAAQASERTTAEQDFGLEEAHDGVAGGTVVTSLPAASKARWARNVPVGKSASLNAILVALHDAETCGVNIALDRFTGHKLLSPYGVAPPLWTKLEDIDYMRLRAGLEQRGMKVSAEEMGRAVALTAAERSFDSAQQWLAGVVWDGVPRVERFFTTYMGAADTPYNRATGRYLWTALAGRVLAPGVKADMVPVAVGTQGCGKSTSIAALAPNPNWYTTADLGDRDDDLRRRMQGRVVVELAELKGLKTKDAEAIKEFLSLTEDTWIEKYVENATTRQRRFVFFGTTNRDDFLSDPTGNRRFLPVKVGQCDPDAIRRDLDQLWAEGAAMFMAEGVAYAEAERLATAQLDDFMENDELVPAMAEWLDAPMEFPDLDDEDDEAKMLGEPKAPVSKQNEKAKVRMTTTVAEVMQGLKMTRDGDPLPMKEQRRVADTLRKLGWEKKRGSTGKRDWLWHRPPQTTTVAVAKDASDLP